MTPLEYQVFDLGIKRDPELPKILTVDDEPSMHSLISDTLSSDYRLFHASNGQEGIQMAARLKPDLILMDMMMPDINGYEAVRLLGVNEDTKNIPVILVTARNFDPTTVHLLQNEKNVVAYINKPFRVKQLRDLVKQHLPPMAA